MRVLVTGASGFTGSQVVPNLLAAGHSVTATVRSPRARAVVEALGAEAVDADLTDEPATMTAFAATGAEALVSLVSLGFGSGGTLVRAATEAGIRRAVFVSTTAIFTSLAPPTKAVRLAAEEAIAGSDLEWTIVRPTMIYGRPGDRNMARLLAALRRAPVVPLPGGGRRLQQPVHVDDLAVAIVGALGPAAVRRSYDVPGPEPLPLRDIVMQAAAAAGRRPRLVPVPLGATIAGARLYERLARRPRLRAEQLERLAEDKAFDPVPAMQDLGHRPRPFDVGIAQEARLLGFAPSSGV